jgi:hypothetical protein
MTVANERGLNPKFKGASSEELLAELAARRAVLVSAMSAELAVWSQIAGPPQAATPLPPSPTSTGAAVASPKTAKAPAKPKRRKRRGAAKARHPSSAPAAKAGNPRAKSASGKTSSEYALEVLAAAKGPLAPKDIAPRMLKAGWHSDSPNPAAVAVTMLKKLAAEGKVRKTEGKNEFRALRSSP